jgi:uncharacterized protein YjlB
MGYRPKVTMKTPRQLHFEKGNDVPNSHLPALLFRSILPPNISKKAECFRRTFRANGWSGIWTDTVYDDTHFHSNAHEVLGVAEGKLTVRLGGGEGRLFRLKAGDMLILAAGIGYRRVGADDGLRLWCLSIGTIAFQYETEGACRTGSAIA